LFLTIYLSPADYHRIHSPINGTITGYFSIPGRLYTVQEFMVQGLPGLFAKNERLITYIDTGSHEAALCKIGAMNVGRMSLSYAPVITNKTFRKREEKIFKEDELTTIAAGDETAIFHMGSTIVLLLEKGMCDLAFCEENAPVTMGSPLGNLLKK
jgi:phosphatidylserine decarboxylase